jgi:hypothetical protein
MQQIDSVKTIQDIYEDGPPQVIPLSMEEPENIQVLQYIAVILQNQGPFTGWRAEVIIPHRVGKISQLYVSSCCLLFAHINAYISTIRLMHPDFAVQNALLAALRMRKRLFVMLISE